MKAIASKSSRSFSGKRLPLRQSVVLGVACCALAAGAMPARSTLIAEEQFLTGAGDYSGGASLVTTVGQSSSSSVGFSGAWAGANTGAFKTSATNLPFAGLVNGGGSLSISASSATAISRAAARSFAASSGQSSLYFSSAFQTDAATIADSGTVAMVGFLSGALPSNAFNSVAGGTWSSTNGNTLNGFAWGMSGGALSVQYQAGGGTLVTANTGFALSAGTPYFLIGHLDVNASGSSDTLSVWVETAMPASQAALGAPAWSISTANIVSSSADLGSLNLWTGYNTGGATESTSFDAIRVGTTFADVAPVPEPSATALALAAGALALLFSARKRSAALLG